MWATESVIKKPFGNEGLNLPPSEIIKIIDFFLKNLSQAFAEQSVGEVYAKTWKIGLDASDPAQSVFGRNSPAMGGCDVDPEYG